MVIDYCTGSSRASWDMLLQYAFVEGETEEEFREAGGRPGAPPGSITPPPPPWPRGVAPAPRN